MSGTKMKRKVTAAAEQVPFTSVKMAVVGATIAAGFYLGMRHRDQRVDLVSAVSFTFPWMRNHTTYAPSREGVIHAVRVTVYPNGVTDETLARDVVLEPSELTSLHDVKRVLGSEVAGCDGGVCRVFTELGLEVQSLSQLTDHQRLFLALPGRPFMWPAFEVGRKVEVLHVESADPHAPITLTTLSDSPRVFELDNFFSADDANALINSALSQTDPDFVLKRSTTGTVGRKVSTQRTSENAFDTVSPVAMKLKRRCFDLLGIRPYDETWADGLQILRYNKTRAYIPHLDYLEAAPGSTHNFDSAGTGTNRYATIFLYLTDVEAGGETVFVKAPPLGQDNMMDEEEALAMVRRTPLTHGLDRDSWEEKMVAQCQTRLAVKPKVGRAALFYSQRPQGGEDPMSLHGGCPVLAGTKWGANLWVWSGPRYGYTAGADADAEPKQLEVTFSSNVPGVDLYWSAGLDKEDQLWGPMGPGLEAHRVNTYPGHTWVVKRGQEVVKRWVMVEANPAPSYVFMG